MQIETSQQQTNSFINSTDGSTVDFETILKTSISSVQLSKDQTKGNAVGIFLQSGQSSFDTTATWQQFTRILKSSGSVWTILDFNGTKSKQGLPEVTRFFDEDTITDASFNSGIIRKRMFRFIFTLGVSTLLVILLLCGLSFIPLVKPMIDFALSQLWLSGTAICAYLLFISWKMVSLINSRKKSTIKAFNTTVTENDTTVISKLHTFFAKRIRTHFKQPVAIFVRDFNSLDAFTRGVIYKVISASGASTDGLVICICGSSQCELFDRLRSDQEFKISILGGRYTILKIS
jgi:hypothetical protein